MISDFDLARRLFPRAADVVREATAGVPATSQVRGTATGDSADGVVTVVLETEAGGETAEMEVPTIGGIAEGSEVLVTLLGGTPVDCTRAGSVDETLASATAAGEAAQAAQAVADAVGQHFWSDDDGAHVTQVTQDEWGDAEGASYHSGPNSLWNSLGMLFRDGLTNLLAIVAGTEPTVAIYDGDGNESGNIVASFTRTLIELGRNATSAVISLCGGRGVVRYAYESDFERYVFHIDSDGDFNVESRYESDDGTSTGVAGVKIGGTEQSQSLYSTEVALVATESDGAVDRIHTGRVTVGSGTSVDDPSGYGDASYVTVDGANVDIKANRVDFADPYNYDYANRGGSTLQLGKPSRYQNSGSYRIATAGIDTYTNGPHVTLPPGSYIVVGAWVFQAGSSSGARNLQLGFRSGASGDLWGEHVRIMAAASNYAILNATALRTLTSETTVYLAGSSSMTTSSAGSAWITAYRLN